MGSAFSRIPCVFNHASSNTKTEAKEDESYKKHRETVQLVMYEDQVYLHMFPVLESEDGDKVKSLTSPDRNFVPRKATLENNFSMSEYQEVREDKLASTFQEGLVG